jgi:hypothetical protein
MGMMGAEAAKFNSNPGHVDKNGRCKTLRNKYCSPMLGMKAAGGIRLFLPEYASLIKRTSL